VTGGHQPAIAPIVSYFVVSFLPPSAAARLARLARRFPASLEPRPQERLHITWRSFDGLPHGHLASLKATLSRVASRHAPFTAELLGAGVFQGGAVWARVCPSGAVCELQADVDTALALEGLPPAAHPFVPHITLGSGPEGTRPPRFLHDLSMRLRLDGFALTSTGSQEYRVVRRYPLASGQLG